MMKRGFLIVAAAILVGAAVPSNATDRVAIRLNGYYFFEPATVRLVVTVEPDKANRLLRIQADGDQFFRSTELSLEGLAEKRIHTVEFKNLPAGSYAVRAEVLSASGVRAMATHALMVTGTGDRDR